MLTHQFSRDFDLGKGALANQNRPTRLPRDGKGTVEHRTFRPCAQTEMPVPIIHTDGLRAQLLLIDFKFTANILSFLPFFRAGDSYPARTRGAARASETLLIIPIGRVLAGLGAEGKSRARAVLLRPPFFGCHHPPSPAFNRGAYLPNDAPIPERAQPRNQHTKRRRLCSAISLQLLQRCADRR